MAQVLPDLKPQSLNSAALGMELQDCMLIARTFEKGAHYTPNEASVYAPISRSLFNMKAISFSVASSMQGYFGNPTEANKAIADSQSFANDALASQSAKGKTDNTLQSLNIGDIQQSTLTGDSFGDKLLQWVRECIPCEDRLLAFLEMFPNVNLLDVLEQALRDTLGVLQMIGNLLTNFDIFNDFCELMSLLSAMCIPDLQRIIALLMSLLTLEIPDLDGLIGFLQSLIGPLFMPILNALTSLLDQFILLVTNPLDCVIDAINLQLRKLGWQIPADSSLIEFNNNLNSGLANLNKFIIDAKAKIQAKLDFYINELKALLGELGAGDSAYINASFRKLQIIRLVSFVVSLINAITKGQIACLGTGLPPERQEIDTFFNDYVNPSGPFDAWIDNDGNLQIDERVPGRDKAVEGLPNLGNVLEYDGEPLFDSSLAQTIQETGAILARPARAVVRCKLELTADDVGIVNQFISELNTA